MDEVWEDTNAEYRVLVDLLYPFALSRFDGGLRTWDAADVKALGLLAIDVAALGLLVATRDSLTRFWWIAAAACAVAGVLHTAALARRTANEGPSVLWWYGALGATAALPVEAARTMLDALLVASRENDRVTNVELSFVHAGFIALSAGIVASIPIVLLGRG